MNIKYNNSNDWIVLDTKKMPLGKISKSQLAKGFDVLDELEAAVKGKKSSLSELSSKFYTVIPHSFGRSVPPVISTMHMVNSKKEMLLVSKSTNTTVCSLNMRVCCVLLSDSTH